MELELLLIWAVIATIVLLLSFVALIKLKNKHKNQINELQSKLETIPVLANATGGKIQDMPRFGQFS